MSQPSLARGVGIVSSLTLVSRVLGFIRDLLMAQLFGAGAIADAFFVAFKIPNILRSFLAEGALTSAFVPIFASEANKGKDSMRDTLNAVCTTLFMVTVIISVLGMIFTPQIVDLIAPGFSATLDKQELCIILTKIMLPYIIFVSFVAIINGALNTVNIFGFNAFAQIVMNLVLIVFIFTAHYFDDYSRAIVLSIGVLIGGTLQLVSQIPGLSKAGFRIRPIKHFFTAPIKQMLTLMIPAVLGSAVYQISIFINTILASLLQEGSVSWLFYADRFSQLPIGIFAIALASVLLPSLSKAFDSNNHKLFAEHLLSGLRFASFLIIPIAAGIFIYALPIISILFERGAFTHRSSIYTAWALQALALGIWSVSCQSIIVRAFIAQKDTKTPAIIGLVSLLVSFTFSMLLMGTPINDGVGIITNGIIAVQSGLTSIFPSVSLGHVGLSLAITISSLSSLMLLIILLSFRIKSISWMSFITASYKSLISAIIMILVLNQINLAIESYLLQLVIGVPVGIVVYIVSAYFLNNAELQETFLQLKRLVSKRERKQS